MSFYTKLFFSLFPILNGIHYKLGGFDGQSKKVFCRELIMIFVRGFKLIEEFFTV